jgi:hypothetical protein
MMTGLGKLAEVYPGFFCTSYCFDLNYRVHFIAFIKKIAAIKNDGYLFIYMISQLIAGAMYSSS